MNDSYAFPVPCSRPAISSAGVLPLMLVKSTLRIILFFLFLAILAVAQDWLIGYGLRTIETSKFGSLNRIMSGRVNADVLIIGSSRALSHYDPRIIQSIFGGTAYNIGMDALQIDSQLALLRTYLKHNTAPEIVILNLDLFSFEATKSGEIYDPARYVPYLYEKELYEPLHRIDANVWRWKNIPLYGYTVEDMSFTWVWGVLSCLGINPAEDYFLGFNPKNTRWTDDFERFRADHPQGVTYSISDRGLQAFRDLIRTCRNKRIEIVLVYSPEYCEMHALETNRAEIMEMFRAIASEFHIPFWDYSDSAFSYQRELFQNSQHLNAAGASIFTRDIADRLRNCFHDVSPSS